MKVVNQILFILIMAIGSATFAQQVAEGTAFGSPPEFIAKMKMRADSLSSVLLTVRTDSTLVQTFVEYAEAWQVLNLDSAYNILLRARPLAIRTGMIAHEVKIISQIGAVFQERSDYMRAIAYYSEALELAEEHQLEEDVLEGFQRTLNLYFYLGYFAEAMKLSTRGLRIGEQRNDHALQAYYLNLIGFIYLRQNDIEQSEKHYRTYLALGEKLGDSVIIADGYSNLAEVYTIKSNPQQALAYLEQCLNIYLRLYARSELPKGDRLAYTYFKIACVLRSQKRYEDALKNYLIAINYTKKTPSNKYDIASFYIFTGDTYKELRNFNQALAFLRAGLSLSRQIRHRENIRDAYNFIAQTYAMRKRYDSAYHFQKMYDQLEDSIVNEKSRLEIEQVMATYSLEKKDAEIASLTQQKKLSEAEAERQRITRNAVMILMALSLIVIYLLYNRYRLKQKNRFHLEMNRQQNKMFNAIASVQEQERKRIAQEIHDTLGSILSTAKLRLSSLEEFSGDLQPQGKDHFHNVISLLDEAVTELRNISQNIMPATLSKLGLVAALQNLFDKISSYSGIKIQYAVHGMDTRPEESVEIIIYRVILELVNNVIKHAQAENMTVQLIQYTDHINVTVEDDGIGFDLDKIRKQKSGVGLENITSRLAYLKGRIEIDTAPGQGTSLVMDFPLAIQQVPN